jgi:hypothetical protein
LLRTRRHFRSSRSFSVPLMLSSCRFCHSDQPCRRRPMSRPSKRSMQLSFIRIPIAKVRRRCSRTFLRSSSNDGRTMSAAERNCTIGSLLRLGTMACKSTPTNDVGPQHNTDSDRGNHLHRDQAQPSAPARRSARTGQSTSWAARPSRKNAPISRRSFFGDRGTRPSWCGNLRKEGHTDWCTLGPNCSTIVAYALREGGGDEFSDMWSETNLVWRPDKVLEYAQSILAGIEYAKAGPYRGGTGDTDGGLPPGGL